MQHAKTRLAFYSAIAALLLGFMFADPALADGIGKIVAVVQQLFGGPVNPTATTGQVLTKQANGSLAFATPGGGGATLQTAYNGGATIATTGSTPVAISSTAADNDSVLTVIKNPVGAQLGSALTLDMGATTTGYALTINVNGGNSGGGINLVDNGIGTGAAIIKAGTSGRCLDCDQTGASNSDVARFLYSGAGNGDVVSVFKSPTGAQSGSGISLRMGGGGGVTSGAGLSVLMQSGQATGSAISVTGGTVTTSAPVFTSDQTWNAGGVTFVAQLLNITDTASAAASLLVDLQVGGVSKFKVDKSGNVTVAAKLTVVGAIDPTDISVTGTTPFYDSTSSTAAISAAGHGRIRFVTGTGWQVSSDGAAYVTLATGVGSLAATLAVGNTTGANDIIVSSGQQITSAAATDLTLTAASAQAVLIKVAGSQKASFGDSLISITPPDDGSFVVSANGIRTTSVLNGSTFNNTSSTKTGSYLFTGQFLDSGVSSTTIARAVVIEPIINYTGATRTGHYEAFLIKVDETSLPTGTNYLIRTLTGTSGTVDRFSVTNTGAVTIVSTNAFPAITVTGQYYSAQTTCTTTLEWNDGNAQRITLANGGQTFTFANGQAGGRYLIKLKQPAAGAAGTVTWPASVLWPSATPPTLTATNGQTDIVTFYFDGTNFFGGYTLNY